MKKTVLFVMVVLSMLGRTVYAHPPEGIETKYEPSRGELLVIVTHPTDSPEKHFVEKIELTKDNEVIISKRFTMQDNKKFQEAKFLIDIKPDEVIIVRAYCSKEGRVTSRVDISRGQNKNLKDGRYLSSDSMMDIAVTVKDGQIADIEILKHKGGGEKYADKVKSLIDLIIARQSTDVEAITGASVSSNALKKNVNNALKQAEGN